MEIAPGGHKNNLGELWSGRDRLLYILENAQCSSFFSLHDQTAPLRVDALAHKWPRVLRYALPPITLIALTPASARNEGLSLILIAPHWTGKHWLADIVQLLCGQPAPLPLGRDLLTQAHGEVFPPSPRETDSLGFAPERSNLTTVGLPQNEIDTIQGTRAPSTRSLYDCFDHDSFSVLCIDSLVIFAELLEKGRAFSTIKVYWAAITACHVGFDSRPVGQRPLVCIFMKGAWRKLPSERSMTPSWNPPTVLDAGRGIAIISEVRGTNLSSSHIQLHLSLVTT